MKQKQTLSGGLLISKHEMGISCRFWEEGPPDLLTPDQEGIDLGARGTVAGLPAKAMC